MPTLYEQLGGRETINQVIDRFYERILADPRINHFFKAAEMEKLRGRFKIFFAFAFGAPVNYSGRDLRSTHSHLKLDNTHFDALLEHLVASFKQFNIADDLILKVTAILESTRNDVLNRPSARMPDDSGSGCPVHKT